MGVEGEPVAWPRVSPWAVVLVVLAVVGAGAVQTLAGFGFALLAVPIISLTLSMRDTVALAAVLGFVSATVVAARYREHIDRPTVARMVIPALAAMPIGLLVARAVSDDALRIALAISVIAFTVLLASGFRVHHPRPALDVAVGAVSGVLSTTIGTNGPPLVMVLQARGMAPDRFRATLSTVFAIANLATVALLINRMTPGLWLLALGCVPGMWIGWQIGYALGRRLDHARFDRLVRVLLLVTAGTALFAALS